MIISPAETAATQNAIRTETEIFENKRPGVIDAGKSTLQLGLAKHNVPQLQSIYFLINHINNCTKDIYPEIMQKTIKEVSYANQNQPYLAPVCVFVCGYDRLFQKAHRAKHRFHTYFHSFGWDL
jgi:hypothetical protein